MNKKLKELRAKLAAMKAEGLTTLSAMSKLEAEIAALETKKEDATAKRAELKALEETAEDLAAKAEALQTEVDTEEGRIRRGRLAGFFGSNPAARSIISLEDNPALTAGFRSMSDFARSVRAASPGPQSNGIDPRLAAWIQTQNSGQTGAAPTSFMQEGGAAEGYQVPPMFRDTIWNLIVDGDEPDLMNMTDLEPTDSNQVDMLADESTPWGSSGVQANWRSEAAQMSPSKLATKGRSVKLGELYAFTLATEELLEDAPRLNDRLTTKAAAAIKWKVSDAIMWGDGVGKPIGFMNQLAGTTALVTVAAEAAQTAATVVAANVAKMTSRLIGGSLSRSIWLVNPDVLPQIYTMTLSGYPIWSSNNSGFQFAPAGLLLGRPIIPTEHSQTLGTIGDITLVDLKAGYYATRKASGINFASSMHLYFDYNMQAFRWTFRVGGQPYLSAAVAANKGSATKSHFVALATRP